MKIRYKLKKISQTREKKLRVINLAKTIEDEYQKSIKPDESHPDQIVIVKIQEVKKEKNVEAKPATPAASCFSCFRPFKKGQVAPKNQKTRNK